MILPSFLLDPTHSGLNRLEDENWLTILTGRDFERFVKAISRPAEQDTLPEPHGAPSEEFKAQRAKIASGFDIEIVGPPLH